MTNDFLPFKINIRDYLHEESLYTVEFIPNDKSLQTITHVIKINPEEADTEEKIIELISACSPQSYWRDQIRNRTMDLSKHKSMIGKVIPVSKEPEKSLPGSAETVTFSSQQADEVDQFIQSILNEQKTI